MFQVVTSILMGLMFTFVWIQFKDLNIIRPNNTLYIKASDVLMLFILNAILTLFSWTVLNIIHLVII